MPYVRRRATGFLILMAVCLAALILIVFVHFARAHDHNRPVLNDWMKDLHSKSKVLVL
jgi:hypothetical protein